LSPRPSPGVGTGPRPPGGRPAKQLGNQARARLAHARSARAGLNIQRFPASVAGQPPAGAQKDAATSGTPAASRKRLAGNTRSGHSVSPPGRRFPGRTTARRGVVAAPPPRKQPRSRLQPPRRFSENARRGHPRRAQRPAHDPHPARRNGRPNREAAPGQLPGAYGRSRHHPRTAGPVFAACAVRKRPGNL